MEHPMIWLSLIACGDPAAAPEPGPAAPEPAARPTADEVLARHAAVTRQCELLERASWSFDWTASTNDGHSTERKERIRYQGERRPPAEGASEPSRSFTRIHQQTEPSRRFVAFGQAPDGHAWSAGETAIQTELPEEVVASLKAQLDPTPLCNWAARWPVRTLVGPTTFQEFPAWELELVWADGSDLNMFFHRESGLLMGSRAKVGEAESTTTLTEYREVPCAACSGPVLWPSKETAVRQEGPVRITTEQVLQAATVDDPGFKPLGPVEISKVLTAAAEEVANRKE